MHTIAFIMEGRRPRRPLTAGREPALWATPLSQGTAVFARYASKNFIFLLLTLCTLAAAAESTPGERWLFLGDSITQAGHYVDSVETWFLLNETNAPDMICLGLSSETVSGLSEPDHPFPRPCVHTRLERVLQRVKPDRVFACYGMNCAIYHPFSEERFRAYQEGINRLVAEVQAAGADIILLTPPPYAGRVKPKPAPSEGEACSWKEPVPDYNEVLKKYADWILSLDGENGIRVIDIRPALEAFMEKSYPKEPIHPAPYGHQLIAEQLLRGLDKDTGSRLLETGEDDRASDPKWNALLKLVRQQRELSDRALLNDIGHGNPGVMKAFTVSWEEARGQVEPVNRKIESLRCR
jgi:lysophospholipase L1-like esterase